MTDDDAMFAGIAAEAFRRRLDWKASRKPGDPDGGARNSMEWWIFIVSRERCTGAK